MTDPEITALAREYAEQTDGSSADIAYVTAIAENTILFLLRRYCLVEKEGIKTWFNSRRHILSHQDEYAVYIVGESESEAELKLLRCLFPEIAKEVEE